MKVSTVLETNDLRRMLDDAYDDAVSGSTSLRDQLRAKERAAGSLVAGGSLASISRNSASHSYAFGRGNISPADIARGWRILIDLFDAVLTNATDASDIAVKAEMLQRLQPVNEFTKDFTLLRS